MCKKLSHIVRVSRHTHTHPFNGPLSGTTWVSWYQKGKTNLDFTEATDNEWQWHQLGHMQVCTSLQTENHASTPRVSFFTRRTPFLPPNQQHQSTEGTQLQLINKEALLLRQKAEPWQWQSNDMLNQSVCYAVQQRRTEEMHLKFSMNISNIQRTVESRWRHGQTTHRCCWYL